MGKKQGCIFKCMIVSFCFIISINLTDTAASRQTDAERPVKDGTYKVASAVNDSFVWDIADASTKNGGNLQLYTDNNTNAQKFIFTYHSDGYYTITNLNSGKVIDCAEGSSIDDTNIQQSSGNNTDAQLWKLTPAENGYYHLICKANGKAADIQGGDAKSGANIQTEPLNQSATQEFQLAEAKLAEAAVTSKSSNTKEHSKGFYYMLSFFIVAVETAVVIGAGCLFQRIQRKKGEVSADD